MTSQKPFKALTFENVSTGEKFRAWLREDSTVQYFLTRAQVLAYVPIECPIESIVLVHRSLPISLDTKFGSITITDSESILIVCSEGEPDQETINSLCASGFMRDTVINVLRHTNCDVEKARSMLKDHNRIEKMLSTTRQTLQAYPAHADAIIRELRKQHVVRYSPQKWLEDLLLDPGMFDLEDESERSRSQTQSSVTSGDEDRLLDPTSIESMEPEQAALKVAADEGDAYSQYNLGVCYYRGTGCVQSFTEAARYFKLSCDQGFVEGIHNYGVCFYDGNGVEQSYQQAAHYFRIAADMGYSAAQIAYAGCLTRGEGVAKNLTEAARYYKAAADQGSHEGQSNYARHLLHGRGVAMNPVEAARYLKMACEGGAPMDLFNYGMCLYTGHGVRKDLATAVKYFKMSADKGCARAQYNFGVMLYHGTGITRNMVQGVHYLKMAAEQGLPEGQVMYGQCLFHGDGVPCDIPEAARYFKMSAEQGVMEAQQYYEVCLQAMGSGRTGPLFA